MGFFDAFKKHKDKPEEPAEPVKPAETEKSPLEADKSTETAEATEPVKEEFEPVKEDTEPEQPVSAKPPETSSEPVMSITIPDVRKPREPKKPPSDAEICVAALLANTRGGRQKDSNTVVYDYEGIEVALVTCRSDRNGARYHSNPMFFIKLLNDESIVFSRPIGLGHTKQEAIRDAAVVFSASLNNAFDCIHRRNVDILENKFDGNVHTYRYPCDFVGYAFGSETKPSLGSLFALLRNEIVDYLGAKKYHWIEMSVTCSGGEVRASVEINAARSQALSEKLYLMTAGKFTENDNCFYFQTVLMVQDDYTYVCRKDNYNDWNNRLYRYARIALNFMSSGHSEMAVREMLRTNIEDENTVWELMNFLPEIFAQQALGICCSDMYVLNIRGKKFRLNELQISVIRVMRNEVKNFLESKKPEEYNERAILNMSRLFKAYDKKSGIMLMGDLEFDAPDDYEIW